MQPSAAGLGFTAGMPDGRWQNENRCTHAGFRHRELDGERANNLNLCAALAECRIQFSRVLHRAGRYRLRGAGGEFRLSDEPRAGRNADAEACFVTSNDGGQPAAAANPMHNEAVVGWD
jgi:hypothetical protein